MSKRQGEIWLADLNPHYGVEPGKVRPVVIVQSNFLNSVHPSTVICPITTTVMPGAEILRVQLNRKNSGLLKKCDVLVDQIRTIDNGRFKRKVGELNEETMKLLLENLKVVLGIE